jgi:ParB family chromosome partitioning protein
MSARRTALGRGLGALIPKADEAAAPARRSAADEPAAPSERGPLEIAVDAISPNPDQPRRTFDPAQLAELADSIARHGVLQPVVVRRAEGGGYELIVGERRWRASRAAGRETVPAVVADIEPRDRLELAIVENVQRHDLNPIELAHAYRALSDSGATQEEIGARVGLDRSSIANHLRLLELPRDFQEDLEAGALSMGHAKALLQVTSPERQRLLRDRIVRDQLSVRASEQLARDYAGPGRARKPRTAKPEPSGGRRPPADPNLAPIIETLRRSLQTQVRIEGDLERGHIEIDYFGGEDLERIAELLMRGA